MRDGPEEQPRGAGKASKALVNTSAPNIPWDTQLPPNHPMHRHGQGGPGDLTCAQLPSSVS